MKNDLQKKLKVELKGHFVIFHGVPVVSLQGSNVHHNDFYAIVVASSTMHFPIME